MAEIVTKLVNLEGKNKSNYDVFFVVVFSMWGERLKRSDNNFQLNGGLETISKLLLCDYSPETCSNKFKRNKRKRIKDK